MEEGNKQEIRALLSFDSSDSEDEILLKFNLWSRWFFPKFFSFPDASFHKQIDTHNLRIYLGTQKYFIDIAFRGAAKRQPLDAKVMTPDGWSTIGELKKGDFVVGSDGKSNKILDLSPIIDRPVYKIRTEDGRETECDSEHLWTVRKMSNVKEKHVTIDVKQMLDGGYFYNRVDKRYNRQFKEFKYAIETVKPIEFKERHYSIDPYTLGVILGDGNVTKEWGAVRLYFHKDDEKHYRENLVGDISETKFDSRNTNVGRFGINGLGKDIVKLGLNVNCYYKFIPEQYLFGSVEQRRALLEGLMDTDGTIGTTRKRNVASFCSVSENLADGVVDLVRSLGGRAVKKRNIGCLKFNGKDYFRVSMLFTDYKPFRIKRKKNNCGLSKKTFSRIVSIKPIGNKLGRCISIKNQDGLYVTDDYLLTHNTTRTKLFVAFCIANDLDHKRRYIKVLSADGGNSKQIVTDIYNLLINKRVQFYYSEVFEKTVEKRQETMNTFTTATGVKIQADTVGTDQRGDIQEEARPDFIWFDDFEVRKSLRSAVMTQAIWDNMEEARNGLSKDGSALFNCNYLSERGNVHKLVVRHREDVLITPIKKDGKPTWNAYTIEEINTIEANADDFAGEYLCEPSAGADIFFDRDNLDKQEKKEPISVISDFKIFHKYDPSHRYGGGQDIAGGVGLDSSTSVFIDFTTLPAKVVGTFKSNTIKPDVFGYEVIREANLFGQPIVALENNKFDMAIGVLKHQDYPRIYFTEMKETRAGIPPKTRTYGWNTNATSKPKMLFDLKKAVEDGHLELSDPDLIAELRSYTRDDLMDRDDDVRLTTRHFDLLIACAIAFQMKDWAEVKQSSQSNYQQPEYERSGLET